MSTIGLMIHPNEIKATAYLDENIDEKYIANATQIAQDLYILPMVGTGIYNELKTQITAGTVTADNGTLLGTYIQPALKYFVLYEIIEPLTFKFTNKSISKKTSDNSQPVSDAELQRLKDKFKNIAEYYAEKLRVYLIQNAPTLYPLYLSPGVGVDIVYPNNKSFTSSWFLGNNTCCDEIGKAEYPKTCCNGAGYF